MRDIMKSGINNYDNIEEYQRNLLTIFKDVKNGKCDFQMYREEILIILRNLSKYISEEYGESKESINLYEITVPLFDAVKNFEKSEISREQIEIMTKAIKMLTRKTNSQERDNLVKKMIKANLNPLVRLDGLYELYRKQGRL